MCNASTSSVSVATHRGPWTQPGTPHRAHPTHTHKRAHVRTKAKSKSKSKDPGQLFYTVFEFYFVFC